MATFPTRADNSAIEPSYPVKKSSAPNTRVVRFADGKSLSQIGAEVKEFAQKAKDKKLQPEDWEGNTFTISNLGMFGIDDFTAIINPPDACI